MYNIYHNRVAYNQNYFCSISNVHVKSTRNVGCNFYVYSACIHIFKKKFNDAY